MKRVLTLLLFMVICLSFVACEKQLETGLPEVNISRYLPEPDTIRSIAISEYFPLDNFLTEIPETEQEYFLIQMMQFNMEKFEEVTREEYRQAQTEQVLRVQIDYDDTFFSVQYYENEENVFVTVADILNMNEMVYLKGAKEDMNISYIADEAQKLIGGSEGKELPAGAAAPSGFGEIIADLESYDDVWLLIDEKSLFLKHEHLAGKSAKKILDYLTEFDFSKFEKAELRYGALSYADIEIRVKCGSEVYLISFMEYDDALCIMVNNMADITEGSAVYYRAIADDISFETVKAELEKLVE